MGELHDIAEAKPHAAGRARCLDCRHEWQAVAPVGVRWLECPSCSLERGRFIAQHEREGPHWYCGCGNDVFQVMPAGVYCPNCGVWQVGWDDDPLMPAS